MARAVKLSSKPIDRVHARAYRRLLALGGQGLPLEKLLPVFVIFTSLSRVADQSKNICEETLFTALGETKPPKVYGVLFVDEDNAGMSRLAEAVARKLHPGSGAYESAGWAPADAVDPRLMAAMDALGLEAASASPRAVAESTLALSGYQVIVSLAPGALEALPPVPFRTVLLEWSPGALPAANLPEEEARAAYGELYRRLAHDVRVLMEKLRGEGAP